MGGCAGGSSLASAPLRVGDSPAQTEWPNSRALWFPLGSGRWEAAAGSQRVEGEKGWGVSPLPCLVLSLLRF